MLSLVECKGESCNMYKIKEDIEKEIKSLWMGKGGNIEHIQNDIVMVTNIIVEKSRTGFGKGIEFPIQYVLNAVKHFNEAISKRDDYLMADCLYYEWCEIITVYNEVIEGII